MRTFGENESQKQNSEVRQKHFDTQNTHTGQISLFSSHQFIHPAHGLTPVPSALQCTE